jgi:hypothetical protein
VCELVYVAVTEAVQRSPAMFPRMPFPVRDLLFNKKLVVISNGGDTLRKTREPPTAL